MNTRTDGDRVVVELVGKVDSVNASEVEAQLAEATAGASAVTLDATELKYISSAGLRVLLRLRKRLRALSVINAVPEVYDIFDITGFTQILDVRRRLREVSIANLHQIGAGANGKVYRLNNEQVLKVYNPLTNPPEKIEREKEVARAAFVLGIPTALSFDMVRVGDGYGIVYELVDAHTLGETVATQPERADEYATRMARLLKQLHATTFDPGTLPDARLGLHAWADVSERSGYYAPEAIAKVRALIDSIPERDTFVHGDFHPANIMVTGEDELVLIDMGDASAGDPIVDLLGSYQLMRLVTRRPGAAELYTGMSAELLSRVWDVFVREYFGTQDDQEVETIERRLQLYAIIRSMAGITFSTVYNDDEQRRVTAGQITEALLRGCASMGI